MPTVAQIPVMAVARAAEEAARREADPNQVKGGGATRPSDSAPDLCDPAAVEEIANSLLQTSFDQEQVEAYQVQDVNDVDQGPLYLPPTPDDPVPEYDPVGPTPAMFTDIIAYGLWVDTIVDSLGAYVKIQLCDENGTIITGTTGGYRNIYFGTPPSLPPDYGDPTIIIGYILFETPFVDPDTGVTMDGWIPAWNPAHPLLDRYFDNDTVAHSPVAGDIIVANDGFWDALPKGSEGAVLKMVAGMPAWGAGTNAAHDLLDGADDQDTVAHVAQTGDLIVGNAMNNWEALAIGAAGAILTVTAGSAGWLGIGNANQVLTVDPVTTLPVWKAPAGGPHALLDGTIDNDTVAQAPVAGDIIVGHGTPVKWDVLSVGAVGSIMYTDLALGEPDWLPPGTTGWILQTGGVGADPSWVDFRTLAQATGWPQVASTSIHWHPAAASDKTITLIGSGARCRCLDCYIIAGDTLANITAGQVVGYTHQIGWRLDIGDWLEGPHAVGGGSAGIWHDIVTDNVVLKLHSDGAADLWIWAQVIDYGGPSSAGGDYTDAT